MKRWWIGLLALLVAFGYAQAPLSGGSGGGGGSGELVVVDDNPVSAQERITVKIPRRYALHLTETQWNLDLNNPPQGSSGQGCYLVPKTFRGTALDALAAAMGGQLQPINTYPAIKDYNRDGKISENEKGTLICLNQKVLQKFSNDKDGWQLTISVTGSPSSGFGWFVLQDTIVGDSSPVVSISTNSLPSSGSYFRSGTTNGWLDDQIVEAFWFDGSEEEGDYNLTVTFTLAGL